MKIQALTAIIAILAVAPLASAQTVSSTVPVVPAQYVSSSSPIGDGRIVTSYGQGQQAIRTVSASGEVNYQPASYRTVSYQPAASIPPTLNPTPANTITSAPLATAGSFGPCGCRPTTTAVSYPQSVYYPAANGCNPTPISGYPVQAAYPAQTAYQPAAQYGAGYQNGAYIGQGILGQPKAYVDGQPVRNFLRFLTY